MFHHIKKAAYCCLLAGFCCLLASAPLQAQRADSSKISKADSLLKTVIGKSESVKPYREIITAEAKTSTGFFKVHRSGRAHV